MKLLVIKTQKFDQNDQIWKPEKVMITYLCQTEKEIEEKINSTRPYYPEDERYTYHTYDIVLESQEEWIIDIKKITR